MNRRTFLQLSAYTLTWLSVLCHPWGRVNLAKAQTTLLPPGAYGASAYGQGPYGVVPSAPRTSAQLYLPLITKEN